MSYEDPNAPMPVSATTSTPEPAAITSEKKSGSSDWIWPTIMGVIIIKLFGVAGGFVTIGSYYLLKPKFGTWGAVAASGVIGAVVAIGLLAMIR